MARNRTKTETDTQAPVEPRKRTIARRAVIRIDALVELRLATVAKSEKTPKAQFASRIIDQGLRRYKLDEALRGAFGDPDSEALEVA